MLQEPVRPDHLDSDDSEIACTMRNPVYGMADDDVVSSTDNPVLKDEDGAQKASETVTYDVAYPKPALADKGSGVVYDVACRPHQPEQEQGGHYDVTVHPVNKPRKAQAASSSECCEYTDSVQQQGNEDCSSEHLTTFRQCTQ